MNKKDFKVGQKWSTRDGEYVMTIKEISKSPGDPYPITAEDEDGDAEAYTLSGQLLTCDTDGLDLIELVEDVTPTENKPSELLYTTKTVTTHEGFAIYDLKQSVSFTETAGAQVLLTIAKGYDRQEIVIPRDVARNIGKRLIAIVGE